jgi:hypothetical protein
LSSGIKIALPPFNDLQRKVRYRGLAKNANRAFAMLAMLNISKWGQPLTGEVRPTDPDEGEIPPSRPLNGSFSNENSIRFTISSRFTFATACCDYLFSASLVQCRLGSWVWRMTGVP